jgi:hypothetical protein
MKGNYMKIAIIEFLQVNNFADQFCRYLLEQNISNQTILLNQLVVTEQLPSEETVYLLRDTGVIDHEYRRIFLSQLPATAQIYPKRDLIFKFEVKAQVYTWLQHNQYPVLPFYVLPSHLSRDQFEQIHTSTPFKAFTNYVIKPLRSNQGIGVNIFQDQNRLWDFIQTVLAQKNSHWLIQPYIDKSSEYRILFLDNKVFKVFLKEAKVGKGNLFQGAQMLEIKLEQLVKNTGFDPSQMALQFNSYTAIDYIFCETNKLGYVLDLNLFPGIKILDKNAQISVFQHIVNSLKVN